MIAEPSIQSLIVFGISRGIELGMGTGFVVEHEGQPYLITNYHVAAGRDPRSGQPRHPSGAVPDVLRVIQVLHMKDGVIAWEPRDEHVLDTATDSALWLEHPVQGRGVDVVALPLRNTAGTEMHPYSLVEPNRALRAGPSDGVSIVGFPFGLTGGGAIAIWTRGFVASEPEVDLDNLPRFLIDARTRPGQSGSPVIVYTSGGMMPMADGGTVGFAGPVVNLLGVYSGRINTESDLGYVWKVRVVREIVEAQQRGRAGL